MGAVAVSSVTIAVEHVRITSPLAFEVVRRNLEQSLPRLDPGIVQALGADDAAAVRAYEDSGPALSIFLKRDHGALLASFGHRRRALQYEIGNPLTASKMTRHNLAAALYAPLRVVLYEGEEGTAVLEYDRPSSLFGQLGDERVTAIARSLDEALDAALRQAAGAPA